jgi:hypothetical protein
MNMRRGKKKRWTREAGSKSNLKEGVAERKY